MNTAGKSAASLVSLTNALFFAAMGIDSAVMIHYTFDECRKLGRYCLAIQQRHVVDAWASYNDTEG